MMTDMLNIESLIDLFDDNDRVVAAAVDKKIKEGGSEMLDTLLEIASNTKDVSRQNLIKERFLHYSAESSLEQIKSYAEQCATDEASLTEGAYLVSTLMSPGYKRADFYDQLIPLIGEVMSETSQEKTMVENMRIFNHIFYYRYLFKAADPFTFTESSLLLLNVIKERKGNAIALSLLYFAVAQAGGLPIYPMCFKGGFVPVCVENGKILFYLNVFHEGEIFLENNLSEIFKAQGLNVSPDEFEIKKDATILSIYLELLYFFYDQQGNKYKTDLLTRAITNLGSQRYMVIDDEDPE